MDFDIFDNDFIRPLVTLILPGLVAIHSFLLFFAFNQYGNAENSSNAINNFRGEIFTALNQNESLSLTTVTTIVFILLIVSLIVGVILEDLGSRIEILCRKIVKHNKFKYKLISWLFATVILSMIFLFPITLLKLTHYLLNQSCPLILILLLDLFIIIILSYIYNWIADVFSLVGNLEVWYLEYLSKYKSENLNKKKSIWDDFWNKKVLLTAQSRRTELFQNINNSSIDPTQQNTIEKNAQQLFNKIIFQELNKLYIKNESDFNSDWEKYIKLKEEKGSIGVEYIRYIVLRMKFELSMVWSCFISGINYYYISSSDESNFVAKVPFLDNSISWTQLAFTLFLLLSFYLLFEAYSSVEVLYRTRKLLVNNLPEEVEAKEVEAITLEDLKNFFK